MGNSKIQPKRYNTNINLEMLNKVIVGGGCFWCV